MKDVSLEQAQYKDDLTFPDGRGLVLIIFIQHRTESLTFHPENEDTKQSKLLARSRLE